MTDVVVADKQELELIIHFHIEGMSVPEQFGEILGADDDLFRHILVDFRMGVLREHDGYVRRKVLVIDVFQECRFSTARTCDQTYTAPARFRKREVELFVWETHTSCI